MQFLTTPLTDLYKIELEKREDDRGFFARAFCVDEFAEHGLNTHWQQANIAYSKDRGITRGLHYQSSPNAEIKLVRCTKGAVFDVAVDIRPESSTYLQWFGVELSEANKTMLYVPEGFAHGYQVLQAESELYYMVSAKYAPESEGGMRWDDPRLGINWPITDSVTLSEKDEKWSLLS